MPAIQTRAQKTKGAPKPANRSMVDAAKAKKANYEARAGAVPVFNAQERERLIAQAAYFRAEKRGFAPGCELQDWVEAEAEVLRLIGSA